jgi:3-oxoacyl-[acyl-carrier-protein] synthase-1
MHKINILDYALFSSQGNARQTLEAIKNETIKMDSKIVETLDDRLSIPYYLFKNDLNEDNTRIKEAIKSVVKTITDKLSSNKKSNTALIIGTALVDRHLVEAVESSVYEYKKLTYASSKKSIDTFAKEISDELGLHRFTMTISTACTSSANALLEARNLINSGVFEYAIVLGVEVMSQMMSNGFSAMKLLSQDEQRPFDNNRDGLILGEGIAAVLVGKESSSWSLLGAYSNCNSLTITSVGPEGLEYAQVMEQALIFANVQTKDITAVKAHATSTLTNDFSEMNAISRVFTPEVTFTTLKPYIGHTLGACGILELAILMSCIDDGFLPKTINHEDSLMKEYQPISENIECNSGTFMLNYFGFGGNNISLIIKKELV